MAKIKKETLHDALRPLIFLVGSFGLNSKPILMVYNALALSVFAGYYSMELFSMYWYLIHVNDLDRLNRINYGLEKALCSSHLACLLLLHSRKKPLIEFLNLLKTYEMSVGFSKRFRKFKLLFFLMILNLVHCLCFGESVAHGNNVRGNYQHSYLYAATYVHVMSTFCLPLCSILVCVVPHYVVHTLNERLEEFRRCESPTRRARLAVRLILLRTRLDRLTEVTDRLGAPLTFILRSSARFIFVLFVYLCSAFRPAFAAANFKVYAMNLLLLFFYVLYLRTAPSANKTLASIYRVLAESALKDDGSVSTEPISLRSRLLGQRLIHLLNLAHFSVNPAQFTVMGDSVDNADLFTVFAEIIDTFVSCGSLPPDDPDYEIIFMDNRIRNKPR